MERLVGDLTSYSGVWQRIGQDRTGCEVVSKRRRSRLKSKGVVGLEKRRWMDGGEKAKQKRMELGDCLVVGGC